jgi:DNA-binding transcriptional regulator YhcF (GntR family)
VIPFHVQFRPGGKLYDQVVYAATKAMMSGQLRPGDSFPSVRTLSRELKINPNTAHKVITSLVATGLLEIRPGLGAVVAARPEASRREKARLLRGEIEAIVVEAKRLGLQLEDLAESFSDHWKRLSPKTKDSQGGGRSSR